MIAIFFIPLIALCLWSIRKNVRSIRLTQQRLAELRASADALDALLDERLSKWGSPNNSIDLDGVSIDSVVIVENEKGALEFMVHVSGGFGIWHDTEGKKVVLPPGEDHQINGQMVFTMGVVAKDKHLINHVTNRLTEWRDTQTPLRMTWERGKLMVLAKDEKDWLPLPSKDFPDPGEDDDPA